MTTDMQLVPGVDVTQADIDRALDDRERQTGSRYCSDPTILAEIAAVLREAVGEATRKKSARDGRHTAPSAEETNGGLSTVAPTTG